VRTGAGAQRPPAARPARKRIKRDASGARRTRHSFGVPAPYTHHDALSYARNARCAFARSVTAQCAPFGDSPSVMPFSRVYSRRGLKHRPLSPTPLKWAQDDEACRMISWNRRFRGEGQSCVAS
jgi:hypothetical protein